MQIFIADIITDSNFLTTTLIVSVRIEYHFYLEAPISIVGILKTADAKKIAILNEMEFDKHTFHPMQFKQLSPDERQKIFTSQSNVYAAKLHMPLSHDAIEHIEYLRERDLTKSAQLHFEFVIKSLELHGQEVLPQVQVEKHHYTFTISQSDWINKYTQFLKIGKFLLIEFEIPDKHKVLPEWIELYDRLYLRLEQMGNNIRSSNWYETMRDGRLFYENLKFHKDKNKEFVESLKTLFTRDQHSDRGFEDFNNGIYFFFEYLSKFIHDQDKNGQLHSIPIVKKEEAYFVYTLAIGLLNVIGRKLSIK